MQRKSTHDKLIIKHTKPAIHEQLLAKKNTFIILNGVRSDESISELCGGSFVDIALDALGRDSSVSYTYLDPLNPNTPPTLHALGTNMLYHPNGSSASLNYGNGHTYVSTLNNLQQVTHAITTNGATPAFDRYYTYDARGLIDTISSGIDSTMT